MYAIRSYYGLRRIRLARVRIGAVRPGLQHMECAQCARRSASRRCATPADGGDPLMTPRRKRMIAVAAIVIGVGAATAVALQAFQENIRNNFV